jgi:hypothetical protein
MAMKILEHLLTRTSLAVAVILAATALPLTVYGEAHRPNPPTFEDFDTDGDGFVSEDEFLTLRAEHMKARAEAGHMMHGAAKAPPFSDSDTNGDGRLDREEFAAGREAHMRAMREQHGGHPGMKRGGGRHGHGGPMPTFGDLDLDGNGCVDAEEFAKHQAERHGRKPKAE